MRGVSGAPVTETVADLLASGRIEGEARISGTVVTVAESITKARHRWAIVLLDDGTGAIEAHCFPRAWGNLKPHLAPGSRVTLTGRLNLDAASESLQIFASGLIPDPTQATAAKPAKVPFTTALRAALTWSPLPVPAPAPVTVAAGARRLADLLDHEVPAGELADLAHRWLAQEPRAAHALAWFGHPDRQPPR